MKRRRSSATLVLVTALAATLASARPAHAAGPASADGLFNEGVTQMDAGNFDKACPAIEQSFKLDPLPGTLFTLAECESKRGRVATALAHYEEYLAVYAKLSPERKRKQADREKVSRDAIAALAAQVPELTISLPPSAPPGTTVLRDGVAVSPAALGTAVRLDPGPHLVTVQLAGAPSKDSSVTMKPGEKRTLVLEVGAPVEVAAPPPPPPPPSGPSPRRIAAYAAGGVGALGIVVGAVTGGLALGKKSTVNGNCGIGGDPTACNATGFAAASSLKTLGAVSTAGFVIGGVGLAAGVVLFVTEPKPKDAARGVDGVRIAITAQGAVATASW